VITRPRLLIADEPTGNVDPEMALKLLRLFEALNHRVGTTVVVATHDVHLLQKVPDSLIMRLHKGQLSDPTGALRYPPRPSGTPGGAA
jgi:cell division transport system ATP-binding protein